MEDHSKPYSDYTVLSGDTRKGTIAKSFMANVFMWMFAALALSAFMAYAFASSPILLGYLRGETGLTGLGYIVMFAPLAFVFLMSLGYNRLSAPAMTGVFLLYAAVNGISFSFILLTYTASSIIGCFAAASAMFGIMAVLGYTTNQDLTNFGRLMMMGLIGIIIATVINWFMGSERMSYIISIIGVAVFTGLTAYDVQKLKHIGMGVEQEGLPAVSVKKAAIFGALNLYLDFILIFLYLLRLFGGRRD
ncbi:MAG: Bax inhibitor-1/YccA family protein [Chitinophagaceae bacterium]|nr:Bax inhibitor-1/YccA family protein [Chitinophagaceae bacterium]MCB9045951.1 Bax inhibitor-1/YccA family protein [Chitinophagales bacterium]